MIQNQINQKNSKWNIIIIISSIVGFMVCITVLFPQVRRLMMDLASQIVQKEASAYQAWIRVLLSYAIGGICFIFFFDYCTLTKSGRTLVQNVKQEIKYCLSEIDFKVFVKPVLIMSGIYLLGILTIIRANFLYMDDLRRAVAGTRIWYDYSRYVSEFASIFVHGDTNLTDISPLPQLIAVLILAVSSVFLVYIISNRKITVTGLLASIPLGLSPFFLECLSYKFDAPYMALSIFVSIFPFLFIARKKAFLFISFISLLLMCITYQPASGIYMLIAVMLCFRYWNYREKTNKEVLSFLGVSTFVFCLSMLCFRFFLMRPADTYISTNIHSIDSIVSGTLINIKYYAVSINNDLGFIWKIIIVTVLFSFIIKSTYRSAQRKILSFFIVITVIVLSFILSYGVYSLLEKPLFFPRALLGFGVFLAIICISIVNYRKTSTVAVLALNWCLLVFAFSYGNALADQARYAEFRISILLHDLNILYPNVNREGLPIQINNSIDYAPTIKNISKHYPVIERLVPKRLSEDSGWDHYYFLEYYNYSNSKMANVIDNKSTKNYIDFNTLNLPVALDSYYHTIKSDGERILIILKH